MSKPLGERLIDAGLITPDDVQKALQQQRITGHRLGDCLVELGVLQEASLLRFLAGELKTRFVATEKLAKAKIPEDVLNRIPVRMAEAQVLLPLAFDAERGVLAVVMAEPQNVSVLKELALVADAKDVYAYVGIRSGILAGIRRHYYGDPTAFSPALPNAQSLRADLSAIQAYDDPGTQPNIPAVRFNEGDSRPKGRPGTGTRRGSQVRDTFFQSRTPENDFLETLHILVGQLEAARPLPGHSAQLARRAAMVARRLGLGSREVAHVSIAAQLHDLGKGQGRHHTLASNAAAAEWKAEAKRVVRAPIKLFETVHLPVQVNAILAQLYEAYDGSGLPHGAKGDDIALGARVIAAVDAYLDATRNPGNPFGRKLTKDEALGHLRQEAGRLFDPAVVEALGQLQSGELIRQRLRTDGRQIVLCVADEAQRVALDRALAGVGLVTTATAKLDGAIDAVLAGDADLLVLGLDLGAPDVMSVTQFVRAQPEVAGTPVLVLGEPTDNSIKNRLLEYGVNAYLPSPVEPNVAGNTVRGFLNDHIQHGAPGHPVAGSLEELPLRDLLSLCGLERKSGRLRFVNGEREILLYLEAGRVLSAKSGTETGEPVVQRLLALAVEQAEFQFDPDAILLEPAHLDLPLEHLARQPG